MKQLLLWALIVPASLSASSVFAASTLAEPMGHVPSVTVHFADLNIKQEAGAQELLDRITYAARKACGPRPEMGELYLMGKWDDCVNDAMSRAIANVHSPIVKRLARIPDKAPRTSVAAN